MSEVDPGPVRARRGPGEAELGGRDGAGRRRPDRRRQARRRSARRPASPPTSPTTATRYPVGGGSVAEEPDAPPVADPARTPDPVTASSRRRRPAPPDRRVGPRRGRRRPRDRRPLRARPARRRRARQHPGARRGPAPPRRPGADHLPRPVHPARVAGLAARRRGAGALVGRALLAGRVRQPRRRLARPARRARRRCWTTPAPRSSSTTTPATPASATSGWSTARAPATVTLVAGPPRRARRDHRRSSWPPASTPGWPPTPAPSGSATPGPTPTSSPPACWRTGIDHSDDQPAAVRHRAVRLARACCRRSPAGPCSSPRSALGLVWTWSSTAEAAEYGLPGEQLEALVDVVRSTQEADVACVLKGQDDGSWSVSLRSRGGTDLARVAMALGGGGHTLAAGYSSYLDREKTIEALRAELARERPTAADVTDGPPPHGPSVLALALPALGRPRGRAAVPAGRHRRRRAPGHGRRSAASPSAAGCSPGPRRC